MRIGVLTGGSAGATSLDALVGRARDLEQRGFATVWVPQVFGHDALTTSALMGRETRRIEIGTAVVPTQPRHPTALAQQALTAAAACDGRFTLGIGLSHPAVIEGMLGLSYARRVAHMREYLAVLAPLLRGEDTSFAGEEFRVQWSVDLPDRQTVPILLAALGDRMLALAGESTAGTVLWMAGPRAIEHHIAPKLRAAARDAGRPPPRIVAGLHIALTADADAVRDRLSKTLALYARMPSYRALVDIEGSADAGSLALVGDEAALDAGLDRLRDLGVTDFEASIYAADGSTEARTLDYLASRISRTTPVATYPTR